VKESEGFLDRWSRRKREAPEAVTLTPLEEASATPVVADVPAEAEAIGVPALPSIDDLSPESDLSLFMRADVPDALRQQAIKRMWSLDPAIRDFVGLADYAYDYNDPNGVPGFGPMRASDDIAALLRQAIGEPEPQAEEEDEAAGAEDHVAGGEAGTPPVASAESGTDVACELAGAETCGPDVVPGDANTSPPTLGVEQGEQCVPLAQFPLRRDEFPEVAAHLDLSPAFADEPERVGQVRAPGSALAPFRRRHGGAAPR